MANIITTPEVESIPVDSIRKHLKKMHSTSEYLKRYCRWNYYKPHPETQLRFHNSHATERALFLGTQQGKTTAAAFEMAFAATGYWPAWHLGRHPSPPDIERSAKFIGWYCSISSQVVRDSAQTKLLGDISQKDNLGTGSIPLDYIQGVTMARGISSFVDSIALRRETGGTAILQSKTYEQSVLSYQGTSLDMAWVDEDMGFAPPFTDDEVTEMLSTVKYNKRTSSTPADIALFVMLSNGLRQG